MFYFLLMSVLGNAQKVFVKMFVRNFEVMLSLMVIKINGVFVNFCFFDMCFFFPHFV